MPRFARTWLRKLREQVAFGTGILPAVDSCIGVASTASHLTSDAGLLHERRFLHARQHEYEAGGAVGDALMFHGCRSPDDLMFVASWGGVRH